MNSYWPVSMQKLLGKHSLLSLHGNKHLQQRRILQQACPAPLPRVFYQMLAAASKHLPYRHRNTCSFPCYLLFWYW